MFSCIEWTRQVKQKQLNAIDAFVLWEQTVGATEVDSKAKAATDMYFQATSFRDQGTTYSWIEEHHEICF